MARNSQFAENPIFTEPYPSWIEPLPDHHTNARVMRLIKFYILNSPCKVSSWGRKSMEEYGWKNLFTGK